MKTAYRILQLSILLLILLINRLMIIFTNNSSEIFIFIDNVTIIEILLIVIFCSFEFTILFVHFFISTETTIITVILKHLVGIRELVHS